MKHNEENENEDCLLFEPDIRIYTVREMLVHFDKDGKFIDTIHYTKKR